MQVSFKCDGERITLNGVELSKVTLVEITMKLCELPHVMLHFDVDELQFDENAKVTMSSYMKGMADLILSNQSST